MSKMVEAICTVCGQKAQCYIGDESDGNGAVCDDCLEDDYDVEDFDDWEY